MSALTYLSCLLLYLPSCLVQEERRVVVHDHDGRVKEEGDVEGCLVHVGTGVLVLHFSFSLFCIQEALGLNLLFQIYVISKLTTSYSLWSLHPNP